MIPRSCLALTAATIASQPLRVVETRMVAQLVGGERLYTGVFQALGAAGPPGGASGAAGSPAAAGKIYGDEGVAGLFAGLAPTVAGNVAYAVSFNLLLRFVSREITPKMVAAEEQGFNKLVSHQLAIGASNYFFYPFHVVSTILIVQNSGLTASALTPEFDGMLDCLGHLWRQPGQLGTMRGASMLRRFSTKG